MFMMLGSSLLVFIYMTIRLMCFDSSALAERVKLENANIVANKAENSLFIVFLLVLCST